MVKQSIQFSLLSKSSGIQYEFLNNDVRRLHLCNKRNSRNIWQHSFRVVFRGSCAYLPDKVIIWMDNSSIHKTREVYQTLKRPTILELTIPPYSPWLNHWEHLIRSIKTKIRKIQGTGKLITLSTTKQVVDKANQDELKNYFEMSIKETLRFINSETS